MAADAAGRDEAGRDDDDDDEDGASNLATAFNIFSNYVGMVLLSQAYCFRLSGWLALPLLLALTAFGGYTGALIVESSKPLAARGETVPSYAQIGFHAIGPPGKWLVIVSSIVETFFAILNMNIIIWQNAALLLPSVELQWLGELYGVGLEREGVPAFSSLSSSISFSSFSGTT